MLSVVVPTFQERENIADFLIALCASLDAKNMLYEVIVIDDGSPDGTFDVAIETANLLPRVRVERREQKLGAATAVMAGWRMAQGDLLGTINADFQHPPELIAALCSAAAAADLVVASRYCAGGSVGDWPFVRWALSKGAHGLGRILAPRVFSRVADPLSGCFVIRRACIAGIEMRPLGYKTLIETLARGRIERITEVPYTMRARSRGASKVGLRHWIDYGVQVWRLRNLA